MLSQATELQPLDVGGQAHPAFDLSNAPPILEDILAGSEMQTVSVPGVLKDRFDNNSDSSDMMFAPPTDQQIRRVSSPTWMWSPTSIQPRLGTVDQAPWSTWTSSVTVSSTLLTPELDRVSSFPPGQLVPSLQLIRSPRAAVQHSIRLIIQGLRAYPMMGLRRETLPPFIHPHWHRHSVPSLPEPISSCMSVAHMFAFRSEETRPFLWRTVQAEDERFLVQVYTLSHMAVECC
jgi:hypothetical protein